MERLAREKIATQQRLAELKNELGQSMDMLEIDRLLRQTVQPEDDQASTSTASEGEDNFDQDLQLPPQHLTIHPHKLAAAAVTVSTLPSAVTVSVSSSSSQPQALVTPQAIAPAPLPSVPVSTTTTHLVVPQQHPQQTTVIAHASMSHASVIQAVNHVLPAGSKHLAHIAPSGGAPGQAGPTVGQPIGHITVHPVAHLSQHLPALYPQSVAVSGHIAHALTAAHHPSHAPIVNGAVPVTGPQAAATVVGKPTAVVAHHHPQLVGQTVLNPVTMVTVPQFPVSTLKLA
ncbi:hypothetical protein AALO_G00030610 [Alosa alosa]|uniref:Max-binding protein MNT n=1 Tax=Alosa alosa TaxID=278164 RepID=A0AAV6HBP8_9TELE|nr:hypothetical protein AALO_G00030610 [Alosa alosa]